MARTKQRMVAGSAISVEFHCRYSANLIGEIDLVGVAVAPNGHFSRRKVDVFYGGGIAAIMHIDGFFDSAFRPGTFLACRGPGVHTCHVANI